MLRAFRCPTSYISLWHQAKTPPQLSQPTSFFLRFMKLHYLRLLDTIFPCSRSSFFFPALSPYLMISLLFHPIFTVRTAELHHNDCEYAAEPIHGRRNYQRGRCNGGKCNRCPLHISENTEKYEKQHQIWSHFRTG